MKRSKFSEERSPTRSASRRGASAWTRIAPRHPRDRYQAPDRAARNVSCALLAWLFQSPVERHVARQSHAKLASNTAMDLDPRNAAVLAKHVSAETAFDMTGTLATLTDDCVFEDLPTAATYRGRVEVERYYREWWDAFGNVPTRNRLYVSAADRLIVETRFAGTHRGAYHGIAPTGRAIDLPVAIFIVFRDGLMAGERFYYDRLTLLAQIGAV